jgi:polysaccharide pyruvyl transferase WcaK-like protein
MNWQQTEGGRQVSVRGLTGRRAAAGSALRIGLFGLLGAGNIGNDASLESMLGYLAAAHPDAAVDALCAGPRVVAARYGIPATPLYWYYEQELEVPGVVAAVLKVFGKVTDLVRTLRWVRRHDVVIVPGMGILEASLPLRAWQTPYALFLLCAAAKLFGTRVALVSVGAGRINQRLCRWLFNMAARMACYRSYRDEGSREAMRQRGLDTTRDHVYPDLAFALPPEVYGAGDPQKVVVGVMAHYGNNDDRKHANEVHEAYVAKMKAFVGWLVDNNRQVSLIIGDTNGSDVVVAQQIVADINASRPGLDPSHLVAEPIGTFADVARTIQPAGSVVAIRYHNVLCALKLAKPTIAIGYSPKHGALMTDMGLPDFCQPVSSLDVDQLIERFTELERRSAELRQILVEQNAVNSERLGDQFAELSAILRGGRQPVRRPSESLPVVRDVA